MKLRDIQLQFKEYLINGDVAIEEAIVSGPDIHARERLAIYKDGYEQLLVDLIAADFPHLQSLLGEQFETEIQRYITQYPGDHYLPHYLGKHLAQYFADNNKPILWQEMAQLEYAIIEIADKANEEALTLDKLSSLQLELWPTFKFVLSDAATILSFTTTAPFLWNKEEKNENTKTTWLIWRKDFQIKLKQLTQEEIFIFSLMQQQKTFQAICDALSEKMPEQKAAEYLMQFLSQALADKLFKDSMIQCGAK